jgi:putative hemolysin
MEELLKQSNKKYKEFINLDNIIASKNPKLAKRLPRFIKNIIRKIIHERDVNITLTLNEGLKDYEFTKSIVDNTFKSKVYAHGEENLFKSDRFIIASNHPLGGFDGMALVYVTGKHFKNMVFPVNDILMSVDNMANTFIPINKHGRTASNAFKEFDDAFASDKAVLYFPAGFCSRKTKGEICDIEWKKTIITKAKQHKRDIIPTYIEAKNSKFFYRLAALRKFLRIKTNIEMFFLVHELYKQKGKSIHVHFGEPISYSLFDKKKKDNEWAEYVKNIVYEIPKKD